MRVVLVHEAELDFWASVDHYENQEPGLGVRFEHEVDQFLAKIAAGPMRPRLRRNCYRRVNLSVFAAERSGASNYAIDCTSPDEGWGPCGTYCL